MMKRKVLHFCVAEVEKRQQKKKENIKTTTTTITTTTITTTITTSENPNGGSKSFYNIHPDWISEKIGIRNVEQMISCYPSTIRVSY
jgi:hypothetical protein